MILLVFLQDAELNCPTTGDILHAGSLCDPPCAAGLYYPKAYSATCSPCPVGYSIVLWSRNSKYAQLILIFSFPEIIVLGVLPTRFPVPLAPTALAWVFKMIHVRASVGPEPRGIPLGCKRQPAPVHHYVWCSVCFHCPDTALTYSVMLKSQTRFPLLPVVFGRGPWHSIHWSRSHTY